MAGTTARAARAVGRLRPPRRIEHGTELDVVSHLDEVRSRCIVVLCAFIAAFAAAYSVHGRMIEVLNGSLPASIPNPVTLGVAEPFMTSIKLSAWAAIAIALPVIVWQAWGFVAPVFEPAKQRAARGFIVLGTVLFVAGASFAYFVALPSAVSFLTSFDAQYYDVQLRAKEYYSFAAAVLVSVGLVFELPIVLLALMRLGVLPVELIRRNRRTAYVALTLVAVLLPGVDPVLTALMLVPLAMLFEGTVFVGGVLARRAGGVEDARTT